MKLYIYLSFLQDITCLSNRARCLDLQGEYINLHLFIPLIYIYTPKVLNSFNTKPNPELHHLYSICIQFIALIIHITAWALI